MSCVKKRMIFFFLNQINQSTASLKTNKNFKQKFYDWLEKNHTALSKEKRGEKGSDYRLRIYIPNFSWMVVL